MVKLAELLNNDSWAVDEFKGMRIKCGRLLKRFILTMITLSLKPTSSIPAASRDAAEAKAIYRMIDNQRLSDEIIIEAEKRATINKIKSLLAQWCYCKPGS